MLDVVKSAETSSLIRDPLTIPSCGTIVHFSVRISWHPGIVPGPPRDFPGHFRGHSRNSRAIPGALAGWSLGLREGGPGCQEIFTLKCTIVPHKGVAVLTNCLYSNQILASARSDC